ncbi:tagaturonate reductase [Algibacter lectus]|uniref:tagaturonate reductase n=1 Tax=Algibacter lectus TaxID=221126 RepID=UPI0026EB40E7|nr:tagaturonate reductase [Algibacter lectus]MDO7135882.1 tagaturonate reductase [Algibacter lectus]
MTKLNRTTANKPVQHPVRIMQFGGGNFLRAFCDWMFDVLNKTTDFNGSVVVVKPTKRGDYTELRTQDGLFHVALDGVRNGNLVSEVTLVESVSSVIQPYTQWDEYLALAEQPQLRFVVSNTTEAGIKFSETDKLTDCPPHEFPAKLTLWLHHRFNHFNGAADKGCILLPCELIENNGDALLKTILQYAEFWNLSEAFQIWILHHNHFCSTLVDRIVSGFPEGRKTEISQQIGFDDDLLVAGEDYHSWVIKGPELVQDELPFSKTDLNVQFVNDLSDYREMKVRILNGAHTSLVPVGYLAGLRTVKESMDDEVVKNHVLQVLSTEVKPTLTNFSESEIDAFIASVIDRFKNPTLKHYLLAISLNSTSKFQARLLPAFREYTALNETFPKRIAFSLACMIRFYKGEFNNETIDVNDDAKALKFFQKEWGKVDSGEQTLAELVKNTLANKTIVGDNLSEDNGLTTFITEKIKAIETHGVSFALNTLID